MINQLTKVCKYLLYASAAVTVVSMFVWGSLEDIYVGYPRTPNEQLGRIVPHSVKYITVYLTSAESAHLHIVVTVLIISAALTFVGIILNMRWKF